MFGGVSKYSDGIFTIMTVKFSLVIPCFNEERSLKVLIPQLFDIVESNDIEFILVNNGSSDGTADLFNQIDNHRVSTVTLDKNAGYGGGIKAGLLIAKGEFVGWIHADLQYSINEVVNELNMLNHELGFIKGKRIQRTALQNFISLSMSVFESITFKTFMYDINAQPTIFRRSFLVQLKDLPDDFSIDLYTYVLAKKFKLNFIRFKVNFINRSFGNSNWNSGFKSILKMSSRTIKYSLTLRKKF